MTNNEIIDLYRSNDNEKLFKAAWDVTTQYHRDNVYLRGLIEFTNECNLDCHYCGIRKSNDNVLRYTLCSQDIISIAEKGWKDGLKTFVLQGGEELGFDKDTICETVEGIKRVTNNEVAITLSCGIKSLQTFKDFKSAGADRYLLRFETSDEELHKKIRNGITLSKRLEALDNIRAANLQVGSGYMTGLPGETEDIRINNALLCQKLELDMVGIGPFIPHQDTPLGDSKQEDLIHAIRGTALLRLLLPKAHIPATTAAGSLKPTGREDMIKAGANVLMPNLTPVAVKKDYLLYPGKICLDENGSQCMSCMGLRVKSVGREVSMARADALRIQELNV